MNETFNEDNVECYKLSITACFCILLLITSVPLNSVLLWTLLRYKDLRSSLNIFLIILIVFDLVANFLELPFVIASNLSCRYINIPNIHVTLLRKAN